MNLHASIHSTILFQSFPVFSPSPWCCILFRCHSLDKTIELSLIGKVEPLLNWSRLWRVWVILLQELPKEKQAIKQTRLFKGDFDSQLVFYTRPNIVIYVC